MIIDVLEDINQTFALSIPEEEAAYLTLHFQAAVERLRHSSEKRKRQSSSATWALECHNCCEQKLNGNFIKLL